MTTDERLSEIEAIYDNEYSVTEVQELIAALRAANLRIAELEKAVAYYADDRNWQETESDDGRFTFKPCMDINGPYVAKKVLGKP